MNAQTKLLEETSYVPRNSNLNFEQRILNADTSPVLFERSNLYDDLNNIGLATHKMSWGEVDGKYIAFPAVVQKSNLIPILEELSPRDAFNYALQTGEYREFDTPEEAAAYANATNDNEGYKKDWNANIPNGNSFDAWIRNQEQGYRTYGELYNFIKAMSSLKNKRGNDND